MSEMIKTPVELQDGLIYDANGVLVLDVATEMDGEYLASIINNHANLLRIAEAAEAYKQSVEYSVPTAFTWPTGFFFYREQLVDALAARGKDENTL
jgi:hypothetical protein